MARKNIQRSLPSLQDAFKDFIGFSDEESKQIALTRHLESTVNRLRKKSSQPFYSMRTIVDFFGVPLRTVALAYESLEKKGLLIRIRGSQTLLAGKSTSPSKTVRAVVGVPVRLHTFVASPYSRKFYVELEEGLRKCGFVADLIFYRGEEVARPEFAERLAHHNLDSVLWHTPPAMARNAILLLRDQGVQQLLIQPTESQMDLSLPTYLQDWQTGYRDLATDWQQAGVRRVFVPRPMRSSSSRAMRAFASALTEKGLEVQEFSGEPQELWSKLEETSKRTIPGVAFLDQEGADAICNENPVPVEELTRKYRLAFCRGIIRIPYFHHREAKVDVVMFSATEMADRIANDIRRMPVKEGAIFTFKAGYESQVSLSAKIEAL